jgi:signal transduction histidine kinase
LASPLFIRASPILVERVLDNLLHNASKAVPDEGGNLSIHSFQRDRWAVAEIANTGCMPEDERERYLQGEGRGRGLHITRRLINQMGGKMELDARDGEIIFRVMYPLVKET